MGGTVSKKKEAVEGFKSFVAVHPLLAEKVKKGEKSWQEFFEEWYLLGGEDEYWKEFSDGPSLEAEEKSVSSENSAKTTEVLGQILSLVKGVDLQSLQGHVENLSSVVSNVQALVRQFSGSSSDKNVTESTNDLQSHRDMNKPPANPFYFYKD